MCDPWPLLDSVGGNRYAVLNPPCDYLNCRIFLTAQDVWYGENRLKGVALRAPRRRYIGLLCAGSTRIIQNSPNNIRLNPRTVVRDPDEILAKIDRDNWSNHAFTAIQGVIHGFLKNEVRPPKPLG